MRRLMFLLCVMFIALGALPGQAAAKEKEICFAQVPDCITFRFAEYWSENGGLQVFGLPLTPARNEKVGDTKYKVQYFERARFEHHKGDPEPYDVLLGRLGVDQLLAQGRDWQTFPKADPATPHYFAQTGHAIAPQFWGFWSRNGLEFDGNKRGKSPAESLALFGYPVSSAQMELGSDGQMYLTQWFERAKFEFHPENKAPYDVLLGRLGADVLQSVPAPDAAPVKVIGCTPNAPAVTEGAQAWVSDPIPLSPGIDNAVCGRLTLNGAPVAGAEMRAVATYKDEIVKYGPATTGPDGRAQIDFNIGKARNKSIVSIRVTFNAPNAGEYTADTSFRPRYSYEEPPPPAGPVVPNIPTPAGSCAANAPAPIEGAQAWVTVIRPSDPFQFDSICARLIVNGAVVSGAEVNAIAYRHNADAPYGPAFTGADGVAELGFPVAEARDNYMVYIDVAIKAPDGREYTAITFFRPDYEPTQ